MSALGLALAVLVAVPARAAPPRFEAGRHFDLDELTRTTGLHAVDRPIVIDRGRAVYVAGAVRGEAATAQLVWLADHTPYRVRAPLGDWDLRGYRLDRLLYYDSPHARAGLLLTGRSGGETSALYAHWDLKRRRVTAVSEISRSRRGRSASAVRPLGYVARTETFYAVEQRWPTGGARGSSDRAGQTVQILGADRRGELFAGQRLTTERRVRSAHLGPLGRRALIVEYAEAPVRGAGPVGHLVELGGDTVRRLPLPVTAYGIAFSADAQTIFAYSSQRGSVWRIDAQTGKRLGTFRAGGLGHALGRLPNGTLLLVRDAGLSVFDPKGKRRARVAMKRLMGGFSHPEGSVVASGQAVIKNGSSLHFVRVRP